MTEGGKGLCTKRKEKRRMRDIAKTASKELVGFVTATEPRRTPGEEECGGRIRTRHGEKEKHRGRRVGKTEM